MHEQRALAPRDEGQAGEEAAPLLGEVSASFTIGAGVVASGGAAGAITQNAEVPVLAQACAQNTAFCAAQAINIAF